MPQNNVVEKMQTVIIETGTTNALAAFQHKVMADIYKGILEKTLGITEQALFAGLVYRRPAFGLDAFLPCCHMELCR
jgi:hypothetical protein